MSRSIFSTYSTGENRITASIMAVLKSLSLPRIERLLGALLEESSFELVRFHDQPSKGGAGVPDALISSSVQLLVEAKIARDTVNREQLDRHLKRLDEGAFALQRLVLLTPDDTPPAPLASLDDPRLVWASFAAFDQAINELLGDKHEVISEREAFLLRELQSMMNAEGLLGSAKDVVVVAAGDAWPEYQRYAAYVCQENRTFQPVRYLAFYSQGRIYRLVPRILKVYDSVVMQPDIEDGELSDLAQTLLRDGARVEGQAYKVILLSPPEDRQTVRLDHPIANDLTSASGRGIAFTQGQRYVSLEQLQQARTTSDLVEN